MIDTTVHADDTVKLDGVVRAGCDHRAETELKTENEFPTSPIDREAVRWEWDMVRWNPPLGYIHHRFARKRVRHAVSAQGGAQ